MSAGEKEYSEHDVNRMLGEQAIKMRLDSIETVFNRFNDKVLAHMDSEDAKRRECASELRATIESNHEEYHKLFVKKHELRNYAFLIIISVSSCVAAIDWIRDKGTGRDSAHLEQLIEQLIETTKATGGSRG